MKRFKEYIVNEWKLTNDSNVDLRKIKPESYMDLRNLVKQRYKISPKILDLSDVDITNIGDKLGTPERVSDDYEDIPGIFHGLKEVEEINVAGWNTSKIKHFGHIFQGCERLRKIIGIKNWNTKNALGMYGTFGGCFVLNNLDLSKWDVSNCKTFESMFHNCWALTDLKGIENFKISDDAVTLDMFYGCKNEIKPAWYKRKY